MDYMKDHGKGDTIMTEKSEITFMQTRLIRLASEEWHLPIEKIVEIFEKLQKGKRLRTAF